MSDVATSRFRAKSGCEQVQKRHYPITSSARARRVGGTVRPSALAVVRFITRLNLVGCSIGMSAGFVPFKILSTKSPARRYNSGLDHRTLNRRLRRTLERVLPSADGRPRQ